MLDCRVEDIDSGGTQDAQHAVIVDGNISCGIGFAVSQVLDGDAFTLVLDELIGEIVECGDTINTDQAVAFLQSGFLGTHAWLQLCDDHGYAIGHERLFILSTFLDLVEEVSRQCDSHGVLVVTQHGHLLGNEHGIDRLVVQVIQRLVVSH